MDFHDKQAALSKLVELRRSGWLPPNCKRLGDFHGGYFECEHVVPWSTTACNYNAELMLIAQDWASEEFLNTQITPRMQRMKALGRDETLTTNRNVKRLLHDYMNLEFADVYATDLFPFIKPGKMDGPLWRDDLVRCARDFALPQIDIIRPLMAVCLGRSTTFPAICKALKMQLVPPIDTNLPMGPVLYNRGEIYGVTHPGAWGAIRRTRMNAEWQFLAGRLKALRSAGRQ